jgi:hypothetical protein
MKTAIFTISVIFLLSSVKVLAGNDIESPILSEAITVSLLKTLAPVTPKEANFDEEITGMEKDFTIGSLAPTTPESASFDDTILTEMSFKDILHLLAPKSPQEVDFNDPAESIDNFRYLRPATPKEALFEDVR